MASNHNLSFAQRDSSTAAVASNRTAALLAYAQSVILAQGQSYPSNQTTLNSAAVTRNAALDPSALVNY